MYASVRQYEPSMLDGGLRCNLILLLRRRRRRTLWLRSRRVRLLHPNTKSKRRAVLGGRSGCCGCGEKYQSPLFAFSAAAEKGHSIKISQSASCFEFRLDIVRITYAACPTLLYLPPRHDDTICGAQLPKPLQPLHASNLSPQPGRTGRQRKLCLFALVCLRSSLLPSVRPSVCQMRDRPSEAQIEKAA